jgi:hypothetical protein
MLSTALTGHRFDSEARKMVVIAYTDDLIFHTYEPAHSPSLRNIFRTYEQATGAKKNSESKAIPLGRWNTSLFILGMLYGLDTNILSIRYLIRLAPCVDPHSKV